MEFTEDELAFLASIFDAARDGDAAYLREVLAAGYPANLTNTSGDTLLILAAYYCHEEAVGVLLEGGADTERVNDRGQTALAAAVFRRHDGIVRRLLAAGADPEAGARSAVSIADYFGLAEMRAVLQEAKGGRIAGPDPDGQATVAHR